MFANLKNRIFEEVKASPSKFQQLAQAAVSGASSSNTSPAQSETTSTNDNFFSITEEDTPQNSPFKAITTKEENDAMPLAMSTPSVVSAPNKNQLLSSPINSLSSISNGSAVVSRQRKLSNSSIASDVSFRLPTYDSPAVYHLQSDLESASEYEADSNINTKLDLISKEQLHDAYKKALDRYQKYRSRYTDLAKRYRDLERDSTKARGVLVETQDKAIRRIGELREQCVLEQQAKAHLEEALRIEMDDMQCRIKSYQTKLELFDDPNLGSAEILDDSNKNLINLNSAEEDDKKTIDLLKEKISLIEKLELKLQQSQKTIEDLKFSEEENSIQMAQNKLAIHSELEMRESEMKKFKTKIQELEIKNSQIDKENINLKNQCNELMELKEKLKNITEIKQDFEAKIISHDFITGELKQQIKEKEKFIENIKNQNNDSIQKIKVDYESKLQTMRTQNNELSLLLERSNNKSESDLAVVDNELNRIKTENIAMQEIVDRLRQENIELDRKVNDKQNEENNLKRDYQELQENFSNLQKEAENFKNLQRDNANEIKTLKDSLKLTSESNIEIPNLRNMNKSLAEEIEKLQKELINKDENLKETIELQQQLQQQIDNLSKGSDVDELVKKTQEEISQMMLEKQSFKEKTENEKQELKTQIQSIVHEISEMNKELNEVKLSHKNLEEEKQNLEKKIEKMTNEMEVSQAGGQKVEIKLQSIESENSQLAEKNCLLEENLSSLEKLMKQEKSNFKETLDKTKKELQTLNEKFIQMTDENSQLHNAKELIEHELRSLQDQNEAVRKENNNYTEITENLKKDIEKLKTTMKKLQSNSDKTENDSKVNKEKVKEIQLSQKREIENYEKQITNLNKQFLEDFNKLEKSYQEKLSLTELEIKSLNSKLSEIAKDNVSLRDQNDSFKKELDTLNNQNQARLNELENLLKETNDRNQTLQESVKNATDIEKKLQNYEQLKIENEYLNTLTNQLDTDLRKQKDDKQKLQDENKEIKVELYVLNEEKLKLNLDMSEKSNHIKILKKESEEFSKCLQAKLEEAEQEKDHCQFITNQKDSIQKELIICQQKLEEAEKLCEETRISNEEILKENINLKVLLESKNQEFTEFNEKSSVDKLMIIELKKNIDENEVSLGALKNIRSENEHLQNKIQELEIELSEKKNLYIEQKEILDQTLLKPNVEEELKLQNELMKSELNVLHEKSANEILSLKEEITMLQNNSKRLQSEIQDLKKINISEKDEAVLTTIKQERDDLQAKLNKIMHEVNDVSNRNLFLEQKCENYLILEQSNERLKITNEKLSRQLDETLVSMQHNDDIQGNTEFEYLKNIMFQYLTGTVNRNNETLVKVIAAVLKFSPQQTQVAIEKEHQRHSLLGQFNNLL